MPRAFLLVVSLALSGCSAGLAAAGTKVVRALPPGDDQSEISISGSLSRHEVPVGESVRLWIAIRNRTAHEIRDLRLKELAIAGLRARALSWYAGDASRCSLTPPVAGAPGAPLVAAIPDCSLLAQDLKAGQSIVIAGEFVARDERRPQDLTAAISWSDDRDSVSEVAVSLGSLAVPGPCAWLEDVFRVAYKAVKDFAIPLAIVWLGWHLKKIEREQRERKEDRERNERDEKERKERERAQEIRTWNLMLSRSLHLSMRFYAPLAALALAAAGKLEAYHAARTAATAASLTPEGLAEKEEERDESARRAFFYYFAFWARARQMQNMVGVPYFKGRVGEELFAACLDKIRSPYLSSENEAFGIFSGLVSSMVPDESYWSVMGKINNAHGLLELQIFRKAFVSFSSWLQKKPADVPEAAAYLLAVSALLRYEMNRPLKYWYQAAEKIKVDDPTLDRILTIGKQIAARDEMAEEKFQDQLRQYLLEAGVSENRLASLV